MIFGWTLSPASALADGRDPWWGPDKALHYGVSAGLASAGYAFSSLVWERPVERALAGAALALSAGIGKELWDLSGRGHASWKDLTWDALGAASGVGLALTVDVLVLGGAGETRGTRAARLSFRF